MWIDITEQEPEFFHPLHQDFRESIQVTKPVFIFDQCDGVVPAIGVREEKQRWWARLARTGRILMQDTDLVRFWMPMVLPEPASNMKTTVLPSEEEEEYVLTSSSR